ncbi:hypothetical protein, partial [Klebsiella pneumoniae]|uniref:hypothetical protein n=1 Tax=Klebsiella pneumoniae TaxID=573 RepID=UPI001C2F32C8
PGHLKIGVSVRHIFKPISYLEIQLLSGVSGGYIMVLGLRTHITLGRQNNTDHWSYIHGQ